MQHQQLRVGLQCPPKDLQPLPTRASAQRLYPGQLHALRLPPRQPEQVRPDGLPQLCQRLPPLGANPGGTVVSFYLSAHRHRNLRGHARVVDQQRHIGPHAGPIGQLGDLIEQPWR